MIRVMLTSIKYFLLNYITSIEIIGKEKTVADSACFRENKTFQYDIFLFSKKNPKAEKKSTSLDFLKFRKISFRNQLSYSLVTKPRKKIDSI